MQFSAVNLSYDYDDAWPACSLVELDLTARIILATVQSYYGSSLGLNGAINVAVDPSCARFVDARSDEVCVKIDPGTGSARTASYFVNGERRLGVRSVSVNRQKMTVAGKPGDVLQLHVHGVPPCQYNQNTCVARFSGAPLVPSDDFAQSPIVLQLTALLGSVGVEVKLEA